MTHPTLRSGLAVAYLLTAVMLCDILHGSPKYNRKVLVGIDGFRSGDTCVAFVATVESGEFFHGLQFASTLSSWSHFGSRFFGNTNLI